MAVAFTSGSSTTSQRPTPRKITPARTKPAQPTAEETRQLRKRRRETVAGLSEFAIREPAHAIPLRRTGQSEPPCHRSTMGFAHDRCPGHQHFPPQGERRRRYWRVAVPRRRQKKDWREA